MSVPYDSFDYPLYWKKRTYENESEKIALWRLLKKIKKRDSLIDIGGGYGRLTSFCSPFFESCLVLEPSEKLIEIGKEKYKNLSNIYFKKGSLPRLPVNSESCDVAMMIRVIHHLPDSLSVFEEICRILKKDGYFILEFANKIHFKERLKALFKGNFSFAGDQTPVDRRSKKSIGENRIIFLNHHPKKIMNDLKMAGFEVIEILSVSNFRSSLLKKILPLRMLLFLEKKSQKSLSKIFFGPSIFFLARKR